MSLYSASLKQSLRALRQAGVLASAWLAFSLASAEPLPSPPWLTVIRDTPYVFSAGLYNNLSTIRRWVLLEQSYCEVPQRHILFDQRGNFLTWFDNAATVDLNQDRLNTLRAQLFDDQRVHRWIGGSRLDIGYPFALGCDQPHVDLASALGRLLGTNRKDRVWGTWDNMVAGSEQQPIPLVDLVQQVFEDKAKRQDYVASKAVLTALLGQIIIESGAQKRSFSNAQAVGLMQLRPEVLADCEIAPRFHLHRMAQVDCVVRLYQQNDRNLRPAFDARFGTLPANKRERLYSLLLVQAYHSGIGRMLQLLGDDRVGQASRAMAASAERYSAEDLAVGMIFHNMGRIDLGLASLYYLIDVTIASDLVCAAQPNVCPKSTLSPSTNDGLLTLPVQPRD